ncbi:J domain-containing protein [Luteolibacter pohnpeiensis]|uniref:J domain-containing protein n=1 Tax=Luteolibacter pohnpeiensis TaxID=454153 RepID=A0A934S7M2_9BACT|nr:J domain-containing protein [Luteolibacter pohnpeiensis]MBK1883682.1 J domain-containing protein [Luteolibacter pohnpeiensis]
MNESYPLNWPEGWPRHGGDREYGQFKGTQGKVQLELLAEIDKLVLGKEAARYTMADGLVIISTNVPLKRNGLPYANQKEPEDPGVAVYFQRKGKQQCFACDKYDRVWKNMRAIQRTIEALRGIERWGSSDMLDRAFTGFVGLPAPGPRPWWEVLGMNGTESKEAIKERYRELAKRHHPDIGGNPDQFAEINTAYQEAIKS